ncbi:MAG TPA: prolyl aminopeptidase [Myxococcota bacterium]|nr:prolyl aminopeptidase [Myxococcota bacterium]
METLFPLIEPFNSFRLKVSDLHDLYVEEVGNPEGLPVVFVHGGPGGGIDANHRRYFRPELWRVILFDQRGCGKSTPFGELKENTTFDLVGDMERIRNFLRIDKWHVFGGSWGSTLSLAYAITHPTRVLSLVLRGIFLVRKKEINWFYQHGANMFYPEEWEHFLAPIPKSERHDLLTAYHKRLNSIDQSVVKVAARAWSKWEGATSRLRKDEKMIEHFSSEHFAYAFARIENHFFYHQAFFDDDNWILNNAKKIQHIPGIIVQGRYDMPCPPISAYELHKAWPKTEFIMVEEAGHAASEPGITHALINATNHMANV